MPTGLPETSEANSQPNQRLPSTSSDTRQLSLESLESEPEGGSIATVPAIRVTEVSEESNEQNVPVSQAHPESLETEVAELLEETEKEDEDAGGSQEAEAKDRYGRMFGALLMSRIEDMSQGYCCAEGIA